MNINYIFNSKETYLAARASWKAAYIQLTTDARQARREFNAAASLFSKTGRYTYARGADNSAYNEAWKIMDKARSNREVIRREANEALAELVEMKKEAARQWQAAHLMIA